MSDETKESNVVRDGQVRIARWLAAQQELARLKSSINRAECEVANARNELGRWMAPADAKVGEQIAVWHGRTMIQVTKKSDHDFDVVERKGGVSR